MTLKLKTTTVPTQVGKTIYGATEYDLAKPLAKETEKTDDVSKVTSDEDDMDTGLHHRQNTSETVNER